MTRPNSHFLVAMVRSLIVIAMRSEGPQNLFEIVNRTIVILASFAAFPSVFQ